MKTHRAVLVHLPRNKSIDIGFSDITYSVRVGVTGKETKMVLQGISGLFKSGELTAIMGPSGAGKTSLLNILTGFQTRGMGGELRLDEVPLQPGDSRLRRQASYIQQADHLPGLFSVSELMWMAAHLKLGSSLSDKAKKLLIDDILETLSLSECLKTRCEKLSGGQRKRLSIALELIDNPPVLFLDEPTTGLDSLSSLQCVSMLKSLARGGRTIVCTIHQPSATIFHMLDHVYVLAQGHCVYQGSSLNVVPYLNSVGLECPQYHNPADYMLEVVSGEYGDCIDALVTAVKENSWRSPPVQTNGNAIVVETRKDGTVPHKTLVLVAKPSEFTRFWTLLQRFYVQLYRDWTVTHLKLVLHVLVGVVFGLNFTGAGNDASKTFNNVSFLFCTNLYLAYTAVMPAVLRYPSELSVMKKEWFNNWYNLRTYYITSMVATLPTQMMFAAAHSTVSYFLTGQPQEPSRYVMFVCICMLVAAVAESFGIFIGIVCPVVVNGTFFASVYTAYLILFSGFMALLNDIPSWMLWMADISFLRYGVEGLVCALFGNNRKPIPCPPEHMYCHLRTPKKLLQELGMVDVQYWVDATALVGFFLLFRIIGYFFLRRQMMKSS
ncbi:ATP-binding cassette sub-family G member 1 [Schistocerca cancellata]|uniref:ATP-binding cassette sub-family G member 1 n=1 Tax=Schistocerca cancellata TaxID=274614 RepID=UPI0021175B22|nr:ATP-binding cassette sub-family G member 1 [Schistocerca cancellata]